MVHVIWALRYFLKYIFCSLRIKLKSTRKVKKPDLIYQEFYSSHSRQKHLLTGLVNSHAISPCSLSELTVE